MPNYKVKPGKTFGNQKQYKPGDIVELTEEEAAGFLDKLEPTSEGAKKPAASRRVTTTVAKKKNEEK